MFVHDSQTIRITKKQRAAIMRRFRDPFPTDSLLDSNAPLNVLAPLSDKGEIGVVLPEA
jgi:hypothetical protein